MKFFLGALGMFLLLIVAIILVVSGRNRLEDQRKVTTVSGVNLVNYASDDDAVVRYRVDGRVVAPEDHRAVTIEVSKSQRTITYTKGYNGEVIKSQSFANTQESFDRFLRAIQSAGFANEKKLSTSDDERSFCPTGSRFIFELQDGANTTFHLWSTSCQDVKGTFGGSYNTVRDLFTSQIPDYQKVSAGMGI